MLAKTQIRFGGIIGTNSTVLTEDDLIQKILELELWFNTKFPECRLHTFPENSLEPEKKDEVKNEDKANPSI